MEITLTSIEGRVLGALIEKSVTTPEYYPLTLNALTAACNQRSNRDPVMALAEKDVVRAIDGLREKGLAVQRHEVGSRVPKYGHSIERVFELSAHEIGTLCVLLLRGPQTAGEIRNRSGRLCEFGDLGKVEATLAGLMDRPDGPFVVKLPRQAGRREGRYAHLLCGEVEMGDEAENLPPEAATLAVRAEDERIAALEAEVAELRAALGEMEARFDAFRSQFE